MSDQVWDLGFPTFPVFDSVSLALIAEVVLDDGETPEPLFGPCKIGEVGYIFCQRSSSAVPPEGQFVYAVTNYVQSARSPQLGPSVVGSLYNGGVATDGDFIYAVTSPGFGTQPQIQVLDPTTLAVLAVASFGPSSGGALSSPFAPAYANGKVFTGVDLTTFPTAQTFLCVIDTSTLVATTITVANAIEFCVASPDQSRIYAGAQNGVFYVIDTTALVLSPITVPGAFGLLGAALSPNGQTLWVTDGRAIFIYDTTTLTLVTDFAFNEGQRGMIFSSDSSAVFAGGRRINTSSFAQTPILVGGGGLNWLDFPGPRPKVPPPTLQRPRDDNLALGAPRQRVGPAQPSSRQYSIRQGGRGTYS